MPTVRCRLLSVTSALSLLLCIGSAVLWERSYEVYDSFATARGITAVSISSYKGSVRLQLTQTFDADPPGGWRAGAYSHRWTKDFPITYPAAEFLGFGAFAYVMGFGPYGSAWHQNIRELAIPDWFLVLALSVYPVVRRARRRRASLRCETPYCRACGYNLTGNTSGTCPECGRPALGRTGA